MNNHQAAHPASLKTFFLTEMWERYGFYVVQTLLTLYLVLHFQWEDKDVYLLVGSFTALTYLSPLVGGFIADHWLGQKLSIILGAICLFLSYLSLGLLSGEEGLALCLAGIAVGTGLLKPNISSLLGNEYPMGSPDRERGFTIFYMAIATGIILGTTLPSYLQEHYGWNVAFLSAAIGLIFAVCLFVYGVLRYRIRDYTSHSPCFKKQAAATGLLLLLWALSYYTLHNPYLAEILFCAIAVFSFSYLTISFRRANKIQANHTLIIGILCLISVAFWTFYFQIFHSLTLLLKRIAADSLFGIAFPPPYYVAVESIGMILLGLFLGRQKRKFDFHQQILRVGNKFQAAMLLMTAAYGLIIFACYINSDATSLSPLYFIPAYLLISLAELLLSPVGLSAITMLSSPKNVSTMMGIFFVSLGLGGYLSGKLASYTAIPQALLNDSNLAVLKQAYGLCFTHMLYCLLGISLLCIGLNQFIRYCIRSEQRESN